MPRIKLYNYISRSRHQRCSFEKGALKNFEKFTRKHLCQSLFSNKRETPTKIFSCEFCKIFKNTYFVEHLRTNASAPVASINYCKITLFPKQKKFTTITKTLNYDFTTIFHYDFCGKMILPIILLKKIPEVCNCKIMNMLT